MGVSVSHDAGRQHKISFLADKRPTLDVVHRVHRMQHGEGLEDRSISLGLHPGEHDLGLRRVSCEMRCWKGSSADTSIDREAATKT